MGHIPLLDTCIGFWLHLHTFLDLCHRRLSQTGEKGELRKYVRVNHVKSNSSRNNYNSSEESYINFKKKR